MSFASIAGFAVRVLDGTATEAAPELQGDFARLSDGSGDNRQRSPKRNFACVVKFDPPSDLDAFLAAISATEIGVATPVAVTSPADGLTRGATLQCYVWVGQVAYKTKGSGVSQTTTVTAPLTLKEA